MSTSTIETAAFKPTAPDEWVGTAWVTDNYPISLSSIYQAVRLKRVAAKPIPGAQRGILINAADAWAMWGARRIAKLIDADA